MPGSAARTGSSGSATVPHYGVLDIELVGSLDRLAGLAAKVLGAPVALLAFRGTAGCRVSSRRWPGIDGLPDDPQFAAHVLGSDGSLVVRDARKDRRFVGSRLVQHPAGLRFCAAVPLVGSAGVRVGTLCVLDQRPRRLSSAQLDDLSHLAQLMIDQLELSRERARLAAVVESLPFNFWMCDADGRYVLQNEIGQAAWGSHVGLLPQETAVPEAVRARWVATNRRALSGETIRAETSYVIGGSLTHVEEILAPIRDAAGTIWGFVGVNIDIGERRRAEALLQESEARLRAAIESLPFDFWICDAAGRYVMNNATCREHWGSHTGQRPDESDLDPAVTRFWAETNQRVLDGETLRYEVTYGAGPGERHVEAIMAPVHHEGRIIGLVGVNIDLTERKRAEKWIRHLADHDVLTGLPNRRMFQERLGEAISRGRRHDEVTALLLLDLDAFKDVNDALGHDAGDAMLCEVAARLRAGRRDYDTVARLGGDEFALILEDLRRPTDAGRVAAQIVADLQRPFRYGEQELHARVSIGIALFPSDAASAGDLLKHADIALYRAKETCRGGWQFFDEAMRVQVDRRRVVEADLRRALDRSELRVFYQPIVELAHDGTVSFEALVRWQHPERGLVMPGEFLPVAEETGLVVPLGNFVLRQVASDARRWSDAGIRIGRIAVNVAGLQFAAGDLDTTIGETLAAARLPAERLEIEVTEGVFLGRNVGVVADALDRLHRRGVSIVLDDFGTGYASLTHLRQFPIDKLKIDRSFVGGVRDDPNDAAIVRAIIDLGHSLGLQIVAEGVETRAQLEFLQRHGCDHVQGFLIARPAPAAEAISRSVWRSSSAPTPIRQHG